jgi:hypothetical protein
MHLDSDSLSLLHVRRYWWIAAALLLGLWAGAAALWFAGVGSFALGLALLGGTATILGTARGGSLAGVRGEGSPGRLSIENGEVVVAIGGEVRERFPVQEVISGWSEPGGSPGGDVVVLVTRGAVEVRTEVRGRDQAARVLSSVGVAPGQRAVKLRLREKPSRVDRTLSILGLIVTAAIAASLFSWAAWVYGDSYGEAARGSFTIYVVVEIVLAIMGLIFAAMAYRLATRLGTTTLSVGAEGVVVERLLGRRIVWREDLEGAVVEGDALVFHQGRRELLRVRAPAEAARAAAVAIQDALWAAPAQRSRVPGLARAGRSMEAWVADLRALAKPRGGYRDAGVDRADLAAVVKDGAALREQRIAAAVALSASGGEDARTALRIAVDACVDPPLRRTLELVAEGEVEADALEEAMEAEGIGLTPPV